MDVGDIVLPDGSRTVHAVRCMLMLCIRLQSQLLGRDGHTAQARNHRAELDERSDTFEYAHMRPANLLPVSAALTRSSITLQALQPTTAPQNATHPDVLQLRVLWQLLHPLHHPENGRDNVHGRVSLLPQPVDPRERLVDLGLLAVLDHGPDEHRVRLVADLEDVVLRDEAEAGPCGLEVVDCLTHVALGGEYQRGEALVVRFDLISARRTRMTLNEAEVKTPTHLLKLAYLLEPLQHFCVAQLRIPQDGTTRLDRLNDLVGHVAGEGESGRVGVYLHRPSEGLLRPGRHAAISTAHVPASAAIRG